MVSILMSILPKWCELIASGKKTIEVRKTRPKIDTPFKCYIYCTKEFYRKGDGYFQGKYCGSTVGSAKICTNCYEKLRLIRKLLKMVRDTYDKYGKRESK